MQDSKTPPPDELDRVGAEIKRLIMLILKIKGSLN